MRAFRAEQGPRQEYLLYAGSWSTCCIANDEGQARLVGQFDTKLKELADSGRAKEEEVAGLALKCALRLSQDLGPVKELKPGEALPPEAIAVWVEHGGRRYRVKAEPDLARLRDLPERLDDGVRVLVQLIQQADRLARAEDARVFLQLYWSAVKEKLKGLRGRLNGSDGLIEAIDAVLATPKRFRALGRRLTVLARRELAHVLEGSGLTLRQAARARRAARRVAASRNRQASSPSSRPGEFARPKALLRSTSNAYAWVESLSTEVCRAVELRSRGGTQREVGAILFPDRPPGRAQRAVSRHLATFRRACLRARSASP